VRISISIIRNKGVKVGRGRGRRRGRRRRIDTKAGRIGNASVSLTVGVIIVFT
jgi:hypothetical protein